MSSTESPTKKRERWRHRANPWAVRAMFVATVLVFAVIGLVLEVIYGQQLSSRGAGRPALIVWLVYLGLGVLTLIYWRGRPANSMREESWSVHVVGTVIRGAEGQRPLVAQLLIWLSIGQLITLTLGMYGLVEFVGSILG